MSKYSPDHVLELNHSKTVGMHTVATREISVGEPVIEVPCDYALGVCKFN